MEAAALHRSRLDEDEGGQGSSPVNAVHTISASGAFLQGYSANSSLVFRLGGRESHEQASGGRCEG